VAKINGKAIPYIAISGFLIGYGILQAQVAGNAKAITKVEKAPIEIAELKKDVEYLKMGQAEMKITIIQQYLIIVQSM